MEGLKQNPKSNVRKWEYQILDEFLTEQEWGFDGDTRWALTWFEQYQFNPGQNPFHDSDQRGCCVSSFNLSSTSSKF